MDYPIGGMQKTPDALPCGIIARTTILASMADSSRDRTDTFFRYLAWSEEDERWQLVCTDAGHCETPPGTPYPPDRDSHPPRFRSVAIGRTLNDYQVVYVTKGRGSFESQGRIHPVEAGSVFVLFPGVPHRYMPELASGWAEYWVGFKGEQPDALCRNGFLSPDRPFYQVGLQNGILAHYLHVLDLVREQPPLYQPRAAAAILGLIADVLASERRAVQASHSEALVARAKFLMEEKVDGELELNGLGEELGVSTSHLNEVFKSYTSMTPYQYFISVKIGRAKELLERDHPVKEVAFILGFGDEYYFSRLFKNKTGISPSHWKAFVQE
jgi:AraC-like DNA-binding protein